jgi:hypothetical protein
VKEHFKNIFPKYPEQNIQKFYPKQGIGFDFFFTGVTFCCAIFSVFLSWCTIFFARLVRIIWQLAVKLKILWLGNTYSQY